MSRSLKDIEWIQVSAWSFNLPSGEKAEVPEFRISKDTVSLEQFRCFANESGYRTIAEMDDDFPTYLNNWGTVEAAKKKISLNSSPPAYLCFEDAVAFVSHYGMSLPTEFQVYSFYLRCTPQPWEASDNLFYSGPFFDCTSVGQVFAYDPQGRARLIGCPTRSVEDWRREYDDIRPAIPKSISTPFSAFRVVG